MLAWSNIGREVTQYWHMNRSEIELNEDTLALSEDARLSIMAYLIIQSGKPSHIFKVLKTVENFINYEHYEEAAPISTLETGFHIILLEYSDNLIKEKMMFEEEKLLRDQGVYNNDMLDDE